ncbi:unnamed protein product, partial [Ectocarpus sp. 13 AM-2016]
MNLFGQVCGVIRLRTLALLCLSENVVWMAEDAASCRGCIFRWRFGFRRALYEQLFLKNEALVVLVRNMLGIKGDGDVASVMRVFLDVDLRGTHKLDIETFFEYFDIEFSEYNKRAFRLLAFGDEQ